MTISITQLKWNVCFWIWWHRIIISVHGLSLSLMVSFSFVFTHMICTEFSRKQRDCFKVHMTWKIFSAYLKRPFKIQKNGVFLFEISFFVLEILTFLYYANIFVMTSYCLQLNIVKYWINDISGNIEAVFLKLGTINVHHKRITMTPLMVLPWHQFGH